ncbi:hypothetical protein [Glycomyces niveus]|uniref:Secreted protein n=1 Tax=Glycomyces niveus TaxID=2820287 RepID=A0ABS3U0R5_9ACTN|nr:hypothetical protein [Glycomyces sp. NEAU-S30]MBO3732339.1 hypothetical protein [Glycomyces sp. NEAU-S30]
MQRFSDRLGRKLNRTAYRLAMLLAAAAIAVFALPSAAMAEANYYADCELERVICAYGERVGLPQGECMTTSSTYHSTQVCVDYSGDHVYVRDGQADGYGAAAIIYSDNGVAHRWCANAEGAGTWVHCNFNWVEEGDHAVAGGYIIQYYEERMTQLWWWNGK